MEDASTATPLSDQSGSRPEYTAGSLDSAAEVLRRARDGASAPVLSLTDEQLAGMDGDRADQLTALPWLAEHPEQREFAAGVGLRSLVASGQVRIVTDPAGGGTGSRWEAVPVLDGCLVLRRAANVVTSVERTMNTTDGTRLNRLYYYAHPSGVLEEEVTASGIHHFTPLQPDQVPDRIRALVDPAGVAAARSDGGEDLAVPTTGAAGADGGRPGAAGGAAGSAAQDLAQRLTGTLAMSVVTVVRSAGGGVQQLNLAATAEELLLIEGTDAQLNARVLDADGLRATAAQLVALDAG